MKRVFLNDCKRTISYEFKAKHLKIKDYIKIAKILRQEDYLVKNQLKVKLNHRGEDEYKYILEM